MFDPSAYETRRGASHRKIGVAGMANPAVRGIGHASLILVLAASASLAIVQEAPTPQGGLTLGVIAKQLDIAREQIEPTLGAPPLRFRLRGDRNPTAGL